MGFLKLLFAVKIGVLLTLSLASAQSLDPNDISVLFPLPETMEESQLLEPWTQADFGELLPESIFDRLPSLTVDPLHETKREELRVIALRFDPCFPQAETPRGCQAQIRLIWQPLTLDGNQELRAIDAALHSFYNLSSEDFFRLLKNLQTLKLQTGAGDQGPLNVQPRLQQEKMRGLYTEGLLKLVKSFTGAQRLSRITFMRLTGQGKMWIFGGFDIQGQKMTKIMIPRTKGFTQFILNVAPADYFDGNIGPAPAGADTFNTLMTSSKLITSEEGVREEALATYRIENPNLHNPNTMDCVSCHAAQPAQLWAKREFPGLKLDQLAGKSKFTSKFPLANTSPHPERTGLLRAFGYDGREPAISQRVINETAAALEFIETASKKSNGSSKLRLGHQ